MVTLQEEQQWALSLWLIEAFYRMQAGDMCVNNALKDVLVLPFLCDGVRLAERSVIVVPKFSEQNEDAEMEEYSLEENEFYGPSQEPSEDPVSSFDDGIYEY